MRNLLILIALSLFCGLCQFLGDTYGQDIDTDPLVVQAVPQAEYPKLMLGTVVIRMLDGDGKAVLSGETREVSFSDCQFMVQALQAIHSRVDQESGKTLLGGAQSGVRAPAIDLKVEAGRSSQILTVMKNFQEVLLLLSREKVLLALNDKSDEDDDSARNAKIAAIRTTLGIE